MYFGVFTTDFSSNVVILSKPKEIKKAFPQFTTLLWCHSSSILLQVVGLLQLLALQINTISQENDLEDFAISSSQIISETIISQELCYSSGT